MLTNEFTLTQTQTQPTPGMLAFADAEFADQVRRMLEQPSWAS